MWCSVPTAIIRRISGRERGAAKLLSAEGLGSWWGAAAQERFNGRGKLSTAEEIYAIIAGNGTEITRAIFCYFRSLA